MANAQKPQEEVAPIDISNILSYNQFQAIKQFVLNKGKTQTYCNMYNDNPYYEFVNEVYIYLNPRVQLPRREEASKPDLYNSLTMVLWDSREDYPFRYTHLREDVSTEKIYLESDYDTDETMSLKKKILPQYIDRILEQIK